MTRIVLAYDGSPSASAAIVWMRDTWGVDIVTLTLDLGQRDELDAVRERALAAGATRAHVLDIRDGFARDYLLPALRAGAACDDGRPLGRALSRPAIARQLVDVARMEGTRAVAHGAWRDAADRVRLERAIRDLAPDADVRAPLAAWNPSDDEIRALAEARGLRLPADGRRVDGYVTGDVWGRCLRVEAGAAPVDVPGFYVLTRDPAQEPATPAFVEVELERGMPVGINGVAMPLPEIISSLETIAGAHGVGRSEGLDAPGPHSGGGARVYEICESPAATVLDIAQRWLERAVSDEDLWTLQEQVRAAYRDLVHRGAWAGPAREACQAFIDREQTRATGTVRLKLAHGTCRVVLVTVRETADRYAVR